MDYSDFDVGPLTENVMIEIAFSLVGLFDSRSVCGSLALPSLFDSLSLPVYDFLSLCVTVSDSLSPFPSVTLSLSLSL